MSYLHPAHEDDEQPPQPVPPDDGPGEALDDFPIPNRDISFSVLPEPHFSHMTSGLAPKTSFSKSRPHSAQWYS
jgi:hypothetical protein